MGFQFLASLAGFAILGAALPSCEDPASGTRVRRIAPPGQEQDLTEGTVYTVRVRKGITADALEIPVNPATVEQVMKALAARLDPDHKRGIRIIAHKDDQIVIEVPPLDSSEKASVIRGIRATGKLELRAVHPESATQAVRAKAGELIVPGYEYVEYRSKDRSTGKEETEDLLLSKRVEVSGEHVKFAAPDAGQKGTINIRLTSDGGERMIRLTKDLTPGRDRIAVVLDGVILSAPVVQSVPLGAQFIIEGLDSHEESNDLSVALLNPLSNPLEILEVVEKTPAKSDPGAQDNPDNATEASSN